MCRELDALRQSIAAFAAGFDARSLTPAEAGTAVRVCARIEASVASIKALAGARYAEGEAWKIEGFRSASDQLAVQTGMTPSHARRVLDTGRRMADQPEVAAAALSGELSAEQAAAVSDGAAANPAQTKALIERARRSSMPELQEEVSRVKAAACDLEARRRAIHAKRSFRRWTDTEGAFHARFYGLPEDGVVLWQALDSIRRRLIVTRREDGNPNEALEALDYDAAVALVGAAVGQPRHLSPAELIELGLFPDLCDPDPASSREPPPVSRPAGAQPDHPADRADAAAPDVLSFLHQPDPPPRNPAPVGAHGPDPDPDSEPVGPRPQPAAESTGNPSSGDPAIASGPPGGSPGSSIPPGPRRRKRLAGSPYQVLIRVEYDTLVRGHPLEGELCEMVGHGPIPVSVVEQIIADANPFITAVLTHHDRLVGVHHFRRRPNAHQKTALNWLYPTCAARGCNARLGLESDHRDDWARTHYTLLEGLDRLCSHHHSLKTRKNWALVEGTGKRDFVPPTDPRHPNHPNHRPLPTPTAETDPLRPARRQL